MNKKPTILAVDDTELNLDILTRLLKEYDVIPALSGEDALEIAQNEDIDLILLDIMMPMMNGFEVGRCLKSNPAKCDIPIIFITAKTDEESIAKAYEIGGADYVTKPFMPGELLARVKLQLNLRKTIQELKDSITNVKRLNGMLPICAHCKKIRDDKGYWNQIEEYLSMHSDACFSHGMCPGCSDELYGTEDWYIEMKQTKKL
jgi:PleD family two-component response regulator